MCQHFLMSENTTKYWTLISNATDEKMLSVLGLCRVESWEHILRWWVAENYINENKADKPSGFWNSWHQHFFKFGPWALCIRITWDLLQCRSPLRNLHFTPVNQNLLVSLGICIGHKLTICFRFSGKLEKSHLTNPLARSLSILCT